MSFDVTLRPSTGFDVTLWAPPVPPPPPITNTIFGSLSPSGTETNDWSSYELGTRFYPTVDGFVTHMRYWRGVGDDDDTDSREMRLWRDGGELISVGIVSTPGQTGWQVAQLAEPVALTANTVYVVSYSTTKNYAYDPGFFASSGRISDDGLLVAPADGDGGRNGVFREGPTNYPSDSYGSSCYWADVVFVTSLGPTPGVRVWDGSAWVVKPAKVWSGSDWLEKPVKFWNGSSWTLG